ncbi:uncharacterized protein TRIADDRAFT_25021 [Trichoplax adhaerens]|uniref:P-type Cu(+) transporter n=1 Tax=Trichoplax adhaerens TaxID=10228 RepID=B3RXT7_TRIAD|nr:hypothetical protein TRIADDRAFT_25021 [Trichoplax adhaerens]EDV24488.1 hypothetical protein TRIADDRAFT_25021 [Trichoplax adhaerens]|eukprot:XP_002112378.1 hypothetical protein TRIADDRAFT_25021 [Trichoplax adhaerens]
MASNLLGLSPKESDAVSVKASCLSLYISGMTCAFCARTIERELQKQEGIIAVSVALLSSTGNVIYDTNRLKAIQVQSRIQQLGFTASILSEDDQNKSRIEVMIENLTSTTCIADLKSSLQRIQGVQTVTIVYQTKRAIIKFDPNLANIHQIVKKIQNLGYKTNLITHDSMQNNLQCGKDILRWKTVFITSIIFSIPVVVVLIAFNQNRRKQIIIFPGVSLKNLLLLVLCTPIQVLGSLQIYPASYHAIKYRTANMDLLVFITITIAYLYSVIAMIVSAIANPQTSPDTFLENPPLIMTLVSLGRWIESLAKNKALESARRFLPSTSTEALLVVLGANGQIEKEEMIPTDLMQRGDTIKILPATRVLVDGVVIAGSSTVDESVILGETTPVQKQIGDKVFSLSINQQNPLIIRVEGMGMNTLASQIARLIYKGQSLKVPIQLLTHSMANYFFCIIISLSMITLILWIIIGYSNVQLIDFQFNPKFYNIHEVTLEFAFRTAIAVLAVAYPCSLGLATPIALIIGIGIASRNGILIKGEKPLARAKGLTTVFLNKTGTITTGKCNVKLVHSFVDERQCSKSKLIALAGAAEACSEHSVAVAISNYAKEFFQVDVLGDVSDFQEMQGLGIQCTVTDIDNLLENTTYEAISTDYNNTFSISDIPISPNSINKSYKLMRIDSVRSYRVVIGNRQWMHRNCIYIGDDVNDSMLKEERNGRSALLIAVNDLAIGMISVEEKIRYNAQNAIDAMRRMDLDVIMFTGDNRHTATAVASQVGIKHLFAETTKSSQLAILQAMQRKGKVVAALGNDSSDSSILANADIGIAIGSNAHLSIDSASIEIIKDNLVNIVFAIKLVRSINRRIHFNLAIAIMFNVVGICLAAGILHPVGFTLRPWQANACAVSISVLIILSSLSLKWYEICPY